MSDHRTLREKLEAVVHPNSGATDGERENARRLLEKKGWASSASSRPPRQEETSYETCTRRYPLDNWCVTHNARWGRTDYRCSRFNTSSRPLNREDILRQAADNFNVNTDDLKAAFDYMARQAKRSAEAAKKAQEANERYAEQQRVLRTCQYCGREFASMVYRQGHAAFCEADPANITKYDPKDDPNMARCMFCGSMVPAETIARHQNRCPQRTPPRYQNGQRMNGRGSIFTRTANGSHRVAEDATFAFWFDEAKGEDFTVHYDPNTGRARRVDGEERG